MVTKMEVYCKFLKKFSGEKYSTGLYWRWDNSDFWSLYSMMSKKKGPFLTLAMQKFEITFLKFRPETFIPVLAKICAEDVNDDHCIPQQYSEELHRLAEEVMAGEFTIPK